MGNTEETANSEAKPRRQYTVTPELGAAIDKAGRDTTRSGADLFRAMLTAYCVAESLDPAEYLPE